MSYWRVDNFIITLGLSLSLITLIALKSALPEIDIVTFSFLLISISMVYFYLFIYLYSICGFEFNMDFLGEIGWLE